VSRGVVELLMQFTALMTIVGCATWILITFIKRSSTEALPDNAIRGRLDEILDRLVRLENGVDATAVEVERISEAQRFTARVLAERSAGGAIISERPRGTTTPH
jgi:hypothetical protein